MAFLTGYNRRQKIIIDSDTYLSGDESNVPIAIHIPSSNTEFWANDDNNGTYVRFTDSDGATLLKFEVESYDGGGEAAWWHAKIPTLSASVNTEMYIYYNADSTSDGSDKENTWDSSYKAVYHFNQDKPEGAFDDSTSNNNNATNNGSIDGSGQIDRARDFDGINDYLNISDNASLKFGSGAFTVEGWFEIDTMSDQFIISKIAGSPSSNAGWQVVVDVPSNRLRFQWSDGGASPPLAIGIINIAVDTKYYFAAVYDGTEGIVYTNDSAGTPVTATEDSDNTDPVQIGVRATTTNPFDGTIDEITISEGARTANYLEARRQSGLGTWLSFGAEEVLGQVRQRGLGRGIYRGIGRGL